MKNLVITVLMLMCVSCAECADVDGWVINKCIEFCENRGGIDHIDIDGSYQKWCVCENGDYNLHKGEYAKE